MGRTGTLCIQYNPRIPKTPTSTTLSSSENFAMFSKIFISLVVLASTVAAAMPTVNKHAMCTNGKTTANDAACLLFFLSVHVHPADVCRQCCVWFDVLDDIQENL